MGLLFSRIPSHKRAAYDEHQRMVKRIHKKTGADMADIEEWFHVFSKTYSGTLVLTRDQFVYENLVAHGGNTELWQRVFDAQDRSQVGSITFENFIYLMHRVKNSTGERRIKDAFRYFDKDGDGYITEVELAQGLAALYSLPEVERLNQSCLDSGLLSEEEIADPNFRARTIIAKFDYDGDGGLNEHEFVEGCRSDQKIIEVLAIVRGL